jgi:hypothetical protein
VFTFRIGAIVGAVLYKSGIFGTGGAFTGVVNVLIPEVLNVGIDFFALSISFINSESNDTSMPL